MKYRYKTENPKLFDDVTAYFVRESFRQSFNEGWLNSFNEGHKTPFGRVHSETGCIELADFADKGVVKTVERILETKIKGGDLE